MTYGIIKVLFILLFISCMVGPLYLPRLSVYQSQVLIG